MAALGGEIQRRCGALTQKQRLSWGTADVLYGVPNGPSVPANGEDGDNKGSKSCNSGKHCEMRTHLPEEIQEVEGENALSIQHLYASAAKQS